ncbi:hypothetical protein HN446_01740 [bacterium]|nr:hypothetical protein [bacterium]
MVIQNSTKSIIFIVLGSVLFLFSSAPFLLNLVLSLLGLYLINYGLRASGRPPLLYMVQSWFDNLHF